MNLCFGLLLVVFLFGGPGVCPNCSVENQALFKTKIHEIISVVNNGPGETKYSYNALYRQIFI